jgi:hypothetical protein
MSAHTPSVQHHVVPFPLEMLGAAVIGAVLMFGALAIAGDVVPTTMPWDTAGTQIPPETGMLIQRHGEQGASWVTPAVRVYRAGEIAGGR